MRIDLSSIRGDRIGSASQARKQHPQEGHSHLKEHAQARKQVRRQEKKNPQTLPTTGMAFYLVQSNSVNQDSV